MVLGPDWLSFVEFNKAFGESFGEDPRRTDSFSDGGSLDHRHRPWTCRRCSRISLRRTVVTPETEGKTRSRNPRVVVFRFWKNRWVQMVLKGFRLKLFRWTCLTRALHCPSRARLVVTLCKSVRDQLKLFAMCLRRSLKSSKVEASAVCTCFNLGALQGTSEVHKVQRV